MNTDEWEKFPNYFDLFRSLNDYLKKRFREYGDTTPFPATQYLYNFTFIDVLLVILFSFGWTYLRQILTEKVFKPLGRHYGLTPSNQSKMPESAWKFLYFFTAWSFNCYILILSGDYKFFQKPSTVLAGWSPNAPIPNKIYMLYLAQLGFYIHFLYATLFMDEWRKDYIAMIIHHIASIIATTFSFVLRYHNIGCLVMLTHDICDVFLEFSKLNVYFKIQNGKVVRIHELLANVTFLSFIVVWCVGRLYCYPLRVLYTGISDINGLQSVLPFSLLMNSMLWILQLVNIYWFYLILQILYRVAAGQSAEDIREYDEKANQKHGKDV